MLSSMDAFSELACAIFPRTFRMADSPLQTANPASNMQAPAQDMDVATGHCDSSPSPRRFHRTNTPGTYYGRVWYRSLIKR